MPQVFVIGSGAHHRAIGADAPGRASRVLPAERQAFAMELLRESRALSTA